MYFPTYCYCMTKVVFYFYHPFYIMNWNSCYKEEGSFLHLFLYLTINISLYTHGDLLYSMWYNARLPVFLLLLKLPLLGNWNAFQLAPVSFKQASSPLWSVSYFLEPYEVQAHLVLHSFSFGINHFFEKSWFFIGELHTLVTTGISLFSFFSLFWNYSWLTILY